MRAGVMSRDPIDFQELFCLISSYFILRDPHNHRVAAMVLEVLAVTLS
jgi:hypothetical protein